MADITFGYHSLTWGRNFVGFLDDVGSLGFRGIEATGEVAIEYDGKEDAFRKLLKERGLSLVSLHGGGALSDPKQREKDLDRNRRLIDFLARHACPVFVFGAGQRGPKAPTRGDFDRLIESAHLLGAYCKKRGIRACLHPHWGTLVQSRDEVQRVMDESDPDLLYLCPDTADLCRGGSDPVEVIKTLAVRIGYVHFKDVSADGQSERKGSTPSVELGRGTINFPGVLAALKETLYRGWVTIELDSSRKSPKESAAISKKYLRDVLKVRI